MTAPSVLIWPAPTTDHRRQRLQDTAVELGRIDDSDLDGEIRDRLVSDLGPTAIELHSLLRMAALLDLDHLTGHLEAVAEAEWDVQQHGAISGHDICCDGGCSCLRVVRHDRTRCDRCETGPHEVLEQRTDALIDYLRGNVSARGVDEYLSGAA
jgi:hypothetical protein